VIPLQSAKYISLIKQEPDSTIKSVSLTNLLKQTQFNKKKL